MSLKEARKTAEDVRTDIRRGRNPVADRRVARAAVAPKTVPTFQWCADQFIASHEAGWQLRWLQWSPEPSISKQAKQD